MNLLAIDTTAGLCAACVRETDSGRELGRAVLDLGRGHAEHLMATIDEALASAGLTYGELGIIAVAVGPGSFTGVRVGVSAARGLTLALGIPAVGVSNPEAIAAEARVEFSGHPILVAIAAGRGGLYVARYDAWGAESLAPTLASLEEAVALAGSDDVLAGSGAETVAEALGGKPPIAATGATADIATYARIAAARGLPGLPARPLYLRAADAKPQSGFALPRKASQ